MKNLILIAFLIFNISACRIIEKNKSVTKSEQKTESKSEIDSSKSEVAESSTEQSSSSTESEEETEEVEITGAAEIKPDGTIITGVDTVIKFKSQRKTEKTQTDSLITNDSTAIQSDSIARTSEKVDSEDLNRESSADKKIVSGWIIGLIVLLILAALVVIGVVKYKIRLF